VRTGVGPHAVRVLVFTSSMRVGGAESLSIALANALAEQDLDVHFASAGGALRGNLDNRVTYHATDNPNRAPVRVAQTMSLLLREIRPDVIHSHGGSCAVVASVARKASKVPCARVFTHHSRVFRRLPRWIARPMIRACADHYVAISHDKQAHMVALGIPIDKTSIIPNFVDVENVAARVNGIDRARVRRELRIPDGAAVLMMAGRMVRTKRFDVFVRIAATVARRTSGREIHALTVGDGPEVDDVRKVVRDEGAPATIHLLGYQRDIYPSLAISDVVVFPSEHPEVLPMFLIEASAAGRAIVCSGVAGNREIVRDGETGRVVNGGVNAYADTVVSLLEDPASAQRLATAAQANARANFDETRAALATLAVYQRLLAAREPTG
jgi:glycosyltransferase involved in cell wall biosynthesis